MAKVNCGLSFYYHPAKAGWNSWMEFMDGIHGWNSWMEFMMQNIKGKGKFIADKFKLSQDELS